MTLSSEESLFSVIKFNGHLMEGDTNSNSDGFGDWRKLENFDDYIKDSDDIIDLLPLDPFGMDVGMAFTAIRELFEDIEKDFGLKSLGFVTDETVMTNKEDPVFAELKLVWNGAMKLQKEVGDTKVNVESIGSDTKLGPVFRHGGFIMDGDIEEFMGFGCEKYLVLDNAASEFQGCTKFTCDGNGGAPHDALFFALGYMGVRDLMSVEKVCKSLRDAVQNDPLLWRNIHIDPPLSYSITDDALIWLTSRAQGTLQCLSLVECFRITDSALKLVLESNPCLRKLSVPGCLKLSTQVILDNLKASRSLGKPVIKRLRISGLHRTTTKHFEELKFLLGADNHNQLSAHKPRFYKGGNIYLSCDDDRAIDIETCPRCQEIEQVYDCPVESCQEKHQTAQICRGCTYCIVRCFYCGCCIDGYGHGEAFGRDEFCYACLDQLLNCQKMVEVGVRSSKHSIFHEEARYQFCNYG